MPPLPRTGRCAAHRRTRHAQVYRCLCRAWLGRTERYRLRRRSSAGNLRHQDRGAEPRLRARWRALWRIRCRVPSANSRRCRLRRRRAGGVATRALPRRRDRPRAAPLLFTLHGGAQLMRLLLTADPDIEVPPKTYGGIERIVDVLVRRLRSAGHEVGLVARPGSDCPAGAFYPWPGLSSLSATDT